jgi:hypothetical protein
MSELTEFIPQEKIISLKPKCTTILNTFTISNNTEFSGLLGSWIVSTVQHCEEHEVSDTGCV